MPQARRSLTASILGSLLNADALNPRPHASGKLMTPIQTLLIALQSFQVAFLWLHDWLPIPPLNDVQAVRREEGVPKLLLTTVIQSGIWTVPLIFSLRDAGRPYPHWLTTYLWIAYISLFLGELQAWWIPYLVRPDPQRAARYRILFGRTHHLLPYRNGLVPNTLHVVLHLATAATLITLAMR